MKKDERKKEEKESGQIGLFDQFRSDLSARV